METIIRVHKDLDADPFARIDKVPINDPNISYKALGILVYALSKPDGWSLNIKDITKHATDQEKAVRSGIEELVEYKYCRKVKLICSVTKRVKKWLYVIYERPYPGKIEPLSIVEVDPLTQNGEVGTKPLAGKPQVEKPQVEKPQVENGPPINKVFKQLSFLITKEGNNNNKATSGSSADFVVVEIPKKLKNKYLKLEKRILALGWLGSTKELKILFNKDPEYLQAWVEKIELVPGLENPAGLLRKSLRSGNRPTTKKERELEKLKKLGLSEEEAAALL